MAGSSNAASTAVTMAEKPAGKDADLNNRYSHVSNTTTGSMAAPSEGGSYFCAEQVASWSEIERALQEGYDYAACSVTNDRFKERISNLLQTRRAFGTLENLADHEVNLQPGELTHQLIARSSGWIDLDAPDEQTGHVFAQALLQEVSYASFCGVSGIIVQGPRRTSNLPQFAQAINAALSVSSYVQISVLLPIAEENPDKNAKAYVGDPLSIWEAWNTIRSLCGYSNRLNVALQIPSLLPSSIALSRWFAEPIRLLVFSAHCFTLNPKRWPVLFKSQQALFTRFMKLKPVVLLQDTREVEVTGGHSSYLAYIRHLHTRLPAPNPTERFGSGYQDYLQSPLQPLTDHLESVTYEVFEEDPVKYRQYELAILKALRTHAEKSLALAVVGAGRGPLVACALRAAEETKKQLQVYAVEKNPNAYVHLLRRKRKEWGNRVEIIHGDMRSWHPKKLVDIIVSELLGSFGDNELSPECCDGVQRVLNPKGGIMIPQSYSSYLTPITSSKLYSELSTREDLASFETPYVVLLQAFDYLAENQIQRIWEFHHPCPQISLENSHNIRQRRTKFKVAHRGVLHGIAGYFEAVLFDDVELSTRPDTIQTKSPDMISWFPIFFPLKTPMQVTDESEIDVTFWRRTDGRKVWYEWCAENFSLASGKRICTGVSALHNPAGRSCHMQT